MLAYFSDFLFSYLFWLLRISFAFLLLKPYMLKVACVYNNLVNFLGISLGEGLWHICATILSEAKFWIALKSVLVIKRLAVISLFQFITVGCLLFDQVTIKLIDNLYKIIARVSGWLLCTYILIRSLGCGLSWEQCDLRQRDSLHPRQTLKQWTDGNYPAIIWRGEAWVPLFHASHIQVYIWDWTHGTIIRNMYLQWWCRNWN